ncbi:hypothetical protein O3G_MSEX006789 [Manduca sexta]|uniref:Ionotropic glutamate receptor C-terminal domain-containing protein n=1 Tax=Manduca sexta TaxID=7130 RepID=A0A922CKZ3_MANSE|nr:hypothetical protein O3G_MSEX006789 [Manduca sexta]
MWQLLCVLCFFIHKSSAAYVYSESTEIAYQIAGIFEPVALTQQYAFSETMHHVHLTSVRLQPSIIQPSRTDSYSTWRNMCTNQGMRPVVIFGPQNSISDGAVRDQCAIANIPHIQATWQPYDPDLDIEETETEKADENETEAQDEDEEEPKSEFKKISINFYPNSEEIFVFVKEFLFFTANETPITAHDVTRGQNIFKRLVTSREDRVLLDCHVDRVLKYMEEAANFKRLNHYQHYTLVTLDAAIVAETLVKLPINITWLSMTEFEKLTDAQHYLSSRVGKWKGPIPDRSVSVIDMKTDELIMDDVANHIVKALESIEGLEKPENFVCDNEADPWPFGIPLQQAILDTKTIGVTGNIEFDETGQRVNYTLYVNEIYMSNRLTIGEWASNNGSEIIETRQSTIRAENKQRKNFIVISRKQKPYFSDKVLCNKSDVNCIEETADENYEGFSVDLVKAIFDILKEEKFNYTYEFKYDKKYEQGSYDAKEKKWFGVMGAILDKEADLAVCDLTITEERKKVVDFSVPFMSLGISILFTQERKVAPPMFSFLNPYTIDVWMHTATAYCVVSIILFLCSRISPADWENPEPCEKDPEELENIWTFKNCTWLTMGSIMTQGCDILPKAIGTRWVCGMWWFFAMIVCQTYIAQLSASMTASMADEPINNVEELAKQSKILYGAIQGGSTLDFFRTSEDKLFRRMFETMEANPAVYVTTNDEGERRVLNKRHNYAFLMESCAIEYKLKRKCELKKVGGELDNKYYGIAMPANSPFRTHINRAILKLQESTALDKIKKKWWDKKDGANNCASPVDVNDVEGDLELENLMGLFVVLIVGLVFCLFITAAEFLNEVRNIVVREQVTHKEVIIKELKASLNFFQLQKPVLRNPSRAPSLAGSRRSSSSSTERSAKHFNNIENFLAFEKEVH